MNKEEEEVGEERGQRGFEGRRRRVVLRRRMRGGWRRRGG